MVAIFECEAYVAALGEEVTVGMLVEFGGGVVDAYATQFPAGRSLPLTSVSPLRTLLLLQRRSSYSNNDSKQLVLQY